MKEQVIDDPKTQFDSIMTNAHKDNLRAKGIDPDEPSEEEDEQDMIDEVEEQLEAEDEPIVEEESEELMETKSIDKNLGENKQVVNEMTIDQHNKNKVNEAQMKAIAGLREMKAKTTGHLNPEQVKIMQLVLAKAESGKLENPVLAHLVKQKVNLSKTFVQSQVAIKELQVKMMDEIAKTTDAVVKCRGAIENVDKQILDLVNEHAELLD